MQIVQLHPASDAIAYLHRVTHHRIIMTASQNSIFPAWPHPLFLSSAPQTSRHQDRANRRRSYLRHSEGNMASLARRQFLHLVAGAAGLATASGIAKAQSYPTKPVRIIVGFAAGGTTDIVARLMGQWLSEKLGRPFVVENRTGVGGNIGTEAVVKAPADGYTLLLVAPSHAVNAAFYDKLNFNFLDDIAPLASVIRVPLVMEVNPSFPARTIPEFMAYART